MQKSFYDALARPFEKSEKKKRRLLLANRIITLVFYIIYPAMLVVLLIDKDPLLWRVLLVPITSFILVTLLRRIVSAKRPYEIWNEPPLIEKETAGRSFPSRHVFSAFMIAMAALQLCLPVGIVLLAAGAVLAVIRVIARVHFIRDVLAGALIAIGLGLLGFRVF